MTGTDDRVATFVTIHLARFDEPVRLGDGTGPPAGSPLRWLVGADEGRHDTLLEPQVASEFVALGLHDDRASAAACASAAVAAFAGAVETWSGVLVATRSVGTCDFLSHGLRLAESGAKVDGPLVVLTTAGWVFDEHFDMDRAMRFAAAVQRVRASMSHVDGMRSGQAFVFPDFRYDGITLTFWRDEAAMKAFAYRPGVHKTELDAFRSEETADRTSFTRLVAVESHGTWWGLDPVGR